MIAVGVVVVVGRGLVFTAEFRRRARLPKSATDEPSPSGDGTTTAPSASASDRESGVCVGEQGVFALDMEGALGLEKEGFVLDMEC